MLHLDDRFGHWVEIEVDLTDSWHDHTMINHHSYQRQQAYKMSTPCFRYALNDKRDQQNNCCYKSDSDGREYITWLDIWAGSTSISLFFIEVHFASVAHKSFIPLFTVPNHMGSVTGCTAMLVFALNYGVIKLLTFPVSLLSSNFVTSIADGIRLALLTSLEANWYIQ